MATAIALAVTLLTAVVPGESLGVYLDPVREALAGMLADAGGDDGTRAGLETVVGGWDSFVAAVGTDTAGRPAGWPEDISRISDAFGRAAELASAGDRSGATTILEGVADLLEWLPLAKPVVLKFSGYSCKGCKVMEGVLRHTARDYAGRVAIRTINVNSEQELTKQYRVMLLPTMVFLDREGNEQFRVAREMTREEVADKLDILLADK